MQFCKNFPAVFFLSLMLGACSAATPSALPPSLTDTDINMLKDAGALKVEGQSDLDAGRADLAVKDFELALQMDEGDDEARLGLAESYLKLGKSDKADDAFQELILSDKYKTSVMQGMGLVALQRGNLEAAEASLQQALEADPSLWRAWNGLGQIYDFRKQWKASNDAYLKALQYTSKPYFIYNNMGVSYMAQKEFKKAAAAFQQALRYKPSLEIAKTNYNLALAMQHRYDEATLDDDTQDSARTLNNAGYAAMHQGQYKEAERLFVKAIEMSPSFYKTPYYNLQALQQMERKVN